jgi:hypothetical protein
MTSSLVQPNSSQLVSRLSMFQQSGKHFFPVVPNAEISQGTKQEVLTEEQNVQRPRPTNQNQPEILSILFILSKIPQTHTSGWN